MKNYQRQVVNGKLRKTKDPNSRWTLYEFSPNVTSPNVLLNNHYIASANNTSDVVIDDLLYGNDGQVVTVFGSNSGYLIRFNADNQNFVIPHDISLAANDSITFIRHNQMWVLMSYSIVNDVVNFGGSETVLDLAYGNIISMTDFDASQTITSAINARIGDKYLVVSFPGALNPPTLQKNGAMSSSFNLSSDFVAANGSNITLIAISNTELVEISRTVI